MSARVDYKQPPDLVPKVALCGDWIVRHVIMTPKLLHARRHEILWYLSGGFYDHDTMSCSKLTQLVHL